MRGYYVAIDADLLLSLVKQSNALQSLQDAHMNLDIVVERQIKEILSMFWSRFNIQVVVVLEGLRPSCLAESSQDHEVSSLKKSHQVWQTLVDCRNAGKDEASTTEAVFKAILQVYGSRFYMQEVINATKAVANCTFFVAPYTASA